jgi:hypothetical protein
VNVVTEEDGFASAIQRSLEPSAGFEVQAHTAVGADVVVVDTEAAPASEDKQLVAELGLDITIVVAPEIDEEVRERGRTLKASAYVRKDDSAFAIIGLVIELASALTPRRRRPRPPLGSPGVARGHGCAPSDSPASGS